ncbi:ankyrin repeat domain-containing protein 26-like [Ictidomys tridecemlineatus]
MARAWRKFVYISLGIKFFGYTPLGKIHQAARNCELGRIKRYLGRGCNVDGTDHKDRSIKKSHSDDSVFAMVRDSYEAPIKTTISQILPQNSVGHSFGDAHQREKDGINGHTEAEPLWFSSSEEEEEGLDDTKNKQPQVFSEGGPQMCISHSSVEKHYIAKEKADGHAHGIHINFRYTLKEDEVKRKNDMLHEKNKNPLKEKETEFNKEDQVRKQAEISVCTIDTELETARNHFNQVSPSDGTENKLLHKYHKKKDEVSMKRLEMDTVKYQNQEKKCFENTEILREKNTSLPWTQKLNEETLMEIFQDNEKLGIRKVENTSQNFTPESEKQSTERPETDSSQEKKNIDVSNLNGSSEFSSQQVPKSEVKTSDLENELHQTRVMTLATDQINRHLNQRQCQLKEMEHRYQNEEIKRNEHLRKQEASKEKVSKLQRETTLHEDQLRDYQNKGENKIDGIINVQTQFYDVIKKLQARNVRYRLMLEKKYLELINETNHLKEQLDQYGKEKAEEVSIKQDIFIKSLQRNTQSDICLWLNVES